MVSLVAWLDGHEAKPHDRAGEAELHGCVSEIRSLRRTMAWLEIRVAETDPHGCVAEIRRLAFARLLGSSFEGDCVRTVSWPRSQGGTCLGV